jgi:hypothetical protein
MLRMFVILFYVMALPAFSQVNTGPGTGLRVSLIPAGLRAVMADSKGRRANWFFRGRQGDVWVAELRGETGVLIRTEHYNAQGYLVAMIHSGGEVETYAPYRCTDQLGKCRYTKTTADGRKRKYSSEVRETGSTLTVYINGKENSSYKLGLYNIRIMQRQGNYWTKMTRIEN